MQRMTPRQIHDYNEMHSTEGICDSCGEPCDSVLIDNSFDHAFGTEHQYHEGSPCCEAEVVSGGAKTIENVVHVARKQHEHNIMPGDRYLRNVTFHWRQDGPGWFTVKKTLLEKSK